MLVRNCCKGDVRYEWTKLIFRAGLLRTPGNIDMALDIRDHVRNKTLHDNFGGDRFSGGLGKWPTGTRTCVRFYWLRFWLRHEGYSRNRWTSFDGKWLKRRISETPQPLVPKAEASNFTFGVQLKKGEAEHLYSALHGTNHFKALRHGSHSF